MKYIRTKDDVYDTENLIYRIIKDNKVYKSGWDVEKPTFEADILDQADTPEELCDGFYLDLGGEFDDTYLRRKDKFEFLKELAFDYMKKGKEVTLYGFIKTDEGLIYAFKMNNEGKLVVN